MVDLVISSPFGFGNVQRCCCSSSSFGRAFPWNGTAGHFAWVPSNVNVPPQNLIAWSPPAPSWIKLNTDGCSKGNPGPAGAGGVLRDHRGTWLAGFAANLGACSSVLAEWKALRMGMEVAWERGYQRVVCEVDASAILTGLADDVNNISDSDPRLKATIAECKKLLARDGWKCYVVQVPREANSCADFMSKVALSVDGEDAHAIVFPHSPPQLQGALFRDRMGMGVPRGFRHFR